MDMIHFLDCSRDEDWIPCLLEHTEYSARHGLGTGRNDLRGLGACYPGPGARAAPLGQT